MIFKVGGASVVKQVDGERWEKLLNEAKLDFSWYHQRQNRKGQVGWFVRRLDDRAKEARNPSDVLRETVDLRPDHSRAIQYLLASGKKEEAELSLNRIRMKKIELFEKIYGRRVLFASEHDDAGQHHERRRCHLVGGRRAWLGVGGVPSARLMRVQKRFSDTPRPGVLLLGELCLVSRLRRGRSRFWIEWKRKDSL